MTHARTRRIATLALSLALSTSLAACGTDEPGPVDAGSSSNDTDANSNRDASSAGGDTGATTPDSGEDLADTSSSSDSGAASDDAGPTNDAGAADTGTTEDTGSPDDAGAGTDAATDMGAVDTGATPDMGSGVDYSNRPAGECVDISDCGGGNLICDRGAAGGVCSGCGDCSDIPGPNTHTCVFGACVPDCSSDDDCPPGRACNSRGLCTVERCTNDVCPVPWFVCSAPDGICERATCFNNEPCPAQTTCTNGICVEDHSLP